MTSHRALRKCGFGRYETELLARIHGSNADLLDDIRTQKKMNEDLERRLRAVLDDFAKTFA